MGEHDSTNTITVCARCERGEHGLCGGAHGPHACGCAYERPPLGGVRAMDIGDTRPIFRMLNERFANEHSAADTLADALAPKLEELARLRVEVVALRASRAALADSLRTLAGAVGLPPEVVDLGSWECEARAGRLRLIPVSALDAKRLEHGDHVAIFMVGEPR